MSTFLLIDTANLFHRMKNSTRGNIDERLGLCFHMIITSLKKLWIDFNADHLVFALEGKSWRNDYFPEYKLARKAKRNNRTISEIEDDEIFQEAMDDFIKFLRERTNVTVLQSPYTEADDLIAGWIRNHVNDDHIIVSGDSDFEQLVSNNVNLYKPVEKHLMTLNGVFDEKGKPVLDKKTKEPIVVDPEWFLFLKCIRGDSSDGIFSAKPRAQIKKIREVYSDRKTKTYTWNEFMLDEIKDHRGELKKVKQLFEFNNFLIDLTQQPEHIKKEINDAIINGVSAERKDNVGAYLMKFCNRYKLIRIRDNAQTFSPMFSKKYPV